MGLMGLIMRSSHNLTLVLHHHSTWLILGLLFQSIAGWRTLGSPWAMWRGMSLLSWDWLLLLLISIIGWFGLSIGLLKAQCSGLCLFLVMIGNNYFSFLHFFLIWMKLYFGGAKLGSIILTWWVYFLIWVFQWSWKLFKQPQIEQCCWASATFFNSSTISRMVCWCFWWNSPFKF